jgi:hypothetical protein
VKREVVRGDGAERRLVARMAHDVELRRPRPGLHLIEERLHPAHMRGSQHQDRPLPRQRISIDQSERLVAQEHVEHAPQAARGFCRLFFVRRPFQWHVFLPR